MITNKQKIVLCLSSLIATFIAVIVVLPFNVLFSRLGIASENVQTIELLLDMAKDIYSQLQTDVSVSMMKTN